MAGLFKPDIALGGPWSTLASASTVDLGSKPFRCIYITGITTITSFGAATNEFKIVKFEGALKITHNATSLVVPGGMDMTTAAGDILIAVSDGSGNWTLVSYQVASAAPCNDMPLAQVYAKDAAISTSFDPALILLTPAFSIRRVSALLEGSGVSITYSITSGATRGTVTTTHVNGQVVNAGTSVSNATIAVAAVPTGRILELNVTSVTGSPTWFHLALY